VPTPPEFVNEAMADLERTFHDERPPYPVLVSAALAHVQFETIHPFLDGNVRIVGGTMATGRRGSTSSWTASLRPR